MAFHERHHKIEQAPGITRVVQRQDMRVREARSQANLAYKAFASHRVGDLGAQHLDGHIPLVPEITGTIHGCHATGSNQRFDGVSTVEGGGQNGQRGGHGAAENTSRRPQGRDQCASSVTPDLRDGNAEPIPSPSFARLGVRLDNTSQACIVLGHNCNRGHLLPIAAT